MKADGKLIRTSLVLDAMSVILVCVWVLALMDIGSGREPDLVLEWTVVWLTVPLVLVLAKRKREGECSKRRAEPKESRDEDR